MLAIDIRIGSQVVGCVHVVNRGHPQGIDAAEYDDRRQYDYEVLHDDTWKPACSTFGSISHRRSEGAFALAARVLQYVAHPPIPQGTNT